jgi:hypothetical protein
VSFMGTQTVTAPQIQTLGKPPGEQSRVGSSHGTDGEQSPGAIGREHAQHAGAVTSYGQLWGAVTLGPFDVVGEQSHLHSNSTAWRL